MNSIQDKINLIKQSIEERVGCEVTVHEFLNFISFRWDVFENEENDPQHYFIKRKFLELLPLSLPNKEGEDEPLTLELIEANGFKKLSYHLWHDESDAYVSAWSYGDNAILCKKGEAKDFMLAISTDRGFMPATKPLNTVQEIRKAFEIMPESFDFKGGKD